MARTTRRHVGTRRAVAWTAVVVALCAGCAGHSTGTSPAAPAASRQLPRVQPGKLPPIGSFVTGPEGPQVSVPASYLFSLDSAVIRPTAVAGLRKLLPAIRGRSGAVMIYGYTDGLGTVAHNKLLSRERADAVAQWLISNHIDPRRVHPEGKGEATSAIDPAQRRVEIVLK